MGKCDGGKNRERRGEEGTSEGLSEGIKWTWRKHKVEKKDGGRQGVVPVFLFLSWDVPCLWAISVLVISVVVVVVFLCLFKVWSSYVCLWLSVV